MHRISIRLFAGLAEVGGARMVELESEEDSLTLERFQQLLAEQHPQLAAQVFRISIGDRYAEDQDRIDADSDLALIPPVSGG